MNFENYGNKNTEEEAGSGGSSNGYDESGIATSSEELKLPPPLAFTDAPNVMRGVMAHDGFVENQLADATRGAYYNDFAPLNSGQPLKTSTTSEFADLAPQNLKLGGFDASLMQGSTLGVGTSVVYLEQVQARALEPEPIYYEKYSSFTSSSQPQVLLQDIATVFIGRSNVDAESGLEKNKIKGVAYENNGRCTFKVRLYQSSIPGQILCEFQRRSGCVVSFNKFYRRTLADIASHVNKKPGQKSGNWLNTVDRVELAINAEPSVQLDEATAANLISMAGCDNVDVQREGAQALANVAKFPANQEKLAEMHLKSSDGARVVPLLQKLLESVDNELCRSGCVFLASMAAQESMKAVLVQSCLDKMLGVLNAPDSFETSDSKRQVALALNLMSVSCPQEIIGHPRGQDTFNTLKAAFEAKRFPESDSFTTSVRAAYVNLNNSK